MHEETGFTRMEVKTMKRKGRVEVQAAQRCCGGTQGRTGLQGRCGYTEFMTPGDTSISRVVPA